MPLIYSKLFHIEDIMLFKKLTAPESYENPNDKFIRFEKATYFIIVFILPVYTLFNIL